MTARRPAAVATQLMSVAAAAKRLDVSDETVYRLIRIGELRAVSVQASGDTRIRVREDDLAAFIDKRTYQAGGKTA